MTLSMKSFLLDQVRVDVCHLADYLHGNLMEERGVHAQELAVTGGPADDAPEHVAPSLVGRQDPVAHQEGACPGMVCNDPDGYVKVFVLAVFLPGKITDKADERGEQVGVIVALARPGGPR